MILKKDNNLGYSLMEVLVAISVVVVILSLSVVNYRSSTKRAEVVMWADKLVSDIRLMENYALAVKIYNNDMTRNIWGVYLDADTDNRDKYILFNDSRNPTNNYLYDPGEIFRELKLPNNIVIESFRYHFGASSEEFTEGQLSLTFVPPDPEVKIKNHQNTTREYDRVEINLRDVMNGSNKTVVLNFFGLAEVIN